MVANRPGKRRFAIIGAGMAGLSCADGLVTAGHQVTLFDKARGAGGRMSTRRLTTPLGDASFDPGAQYFTAREAGFKHVVADWSRRGIAEPWPAAGPDAWVGTPGMNSVIRDMADRHDTHFGRLVQGIVRAERSWTLVGEHLPTDRFDAVVLALPAEQAATLLGPIDLGMARQAVNARSQPCWTAMFAFYEPLKTKTSVLRDQGLIGWAARNSAKPGRDGPETWVVQANGTWSAEHIANEPLRVEKALLAALSAALSIDIGMPIAAATHRWRYALSTGSDEGALWNPDLGIGVCGDWLLGPRVECAWLSGRTLAAAIEKRARTRKPC